ncbi:MAG TPA: NAD(P)H-quinone oxidoreductase [Solirubrobacteraceae bacterium]|nr:NAD(P)H-quinone oxidoreductase [Solirubrobacteraceae bacterium]
MRAATIRDGRVVVAEHADPQPGKGEVLVSVRAAGLNGADIHQVAGHYPAPPGSPQDIPGLELAGDVAARGPGAERFAEGDRVMAVVGGGGQAELCVVHERQLMPVPESLSWVEAGGVPEVFTTAHDALFTQAGLRSGERLLVHGAAGGVGTAGVQLGVATGAEVTATVRNPDLREGVRALGAHSVIDPEGFADHGPFDVVLELVGAPNIEGDLAALAIWGRIVVIGIGGGAKVDLNLGMLLGKRATLRASTLRPRPLEEKAAAARAMERSVLPLFDRGALRVPVAATYPLDAVAEAYERFTAGGKLGKIVLEL